MNGWELMKMVHVQADWTSLKQQHGWHRDWQEPAPVLYGFMVNDLLRISRIYYILVSSLPGRRFLKNPHDLYTMMN